MTMSKGCIHKYITPRYSWSIAKVGVKHQSINQSIILYNWNIVETHQYNSKLIIKKKITTISIELYNYMGQNGWNWGDNNLRTYHTVYIKESDNI
jgi:hypothetical protein